MSGEVHFSENIMQSVAFPYVAVTRSNLITWLL